MVTGGSGKAAPLFFLGTKNLLDVASITHELFNRPIGHRIEYLPRVDSTNRWLHRLVQEGAAVGTVAYTDFQTAGRGRSGRSWTAPDGSSILHSLALPKFPGGALDSVALLALAIRSGVRSLLGLDAQLKWPNDVEIAGRKVCGILAETVSLPGQQIVIVGAGINCNFMPHAVGDVPGTATSLQAELGKPIAREELAVAVLLAVNELYEAVQMNPDALFERWRSDLTTVGREVVVADTSGTWSGWAEDVNRDGSLIVLRGDASHHSVYAADVSVRLAQ